MQAKVYLSKNTRLHIANVRGTQYSLLEHIHPYTENIHFTTLTVPHYTLNGTTPKVHIRIFELCYNTELSYRLE
jgi:hypothetical protein